jgi:hypothetical protein
LLLTVAISFSSLCRTAGAWDDKADDHERVGKVHVEPDPILIAKMRMGRIIRIANSRMELVPVAVKAEDDDELAGESPPLRLRIPDGAFDQLVFGQESNPEIAARAVAAGKVREKIVAIERICTLTGGQKKKLELAGRGDIERLLDRVRTSRQSFETYYIPDGDVFTLVKELTRETGELRCKLQSDIYDDDSLFAKTLRHDLTQEQVSKYGERSLNDTRARGLKLPDLKSPK